MVVANVVLQAFNAIFSKREKQNLVVVLVVVVVVGQISLIGDVGG